MTVRMSQRSHTDFATDKAIVEVRTSIMSARDLRDGLASLSMTLAEQTDKRGYLLLLDSQLSKTFLESESSRVKAALRPEIAERFKLLLAEHGEITQGIEQIATEDMALLRQALAMKQESGTALTPPIKKDEVFLILVHQWVTGQGPVTCKSLEERVGCNYRTVANAIDALGHAVLRHSDRSVSLKYFPEQDWGRLLAVASRTRSTMLYADASDQPRSTESHLRRLKNLNIKHIVIGGVLGAKRYYGDLDIVGSPRLDICMHAPDKYVDLEFMHALDPALERTRDTHRPARLALHFVRRKDALFDRDPDGSQWANPLECLLNLYNARLDQQARSFQEFLISRGKELNGDS